MPPGRGRSHPDGPKPGSVAAPGGEQQALVCPRPTKIGARGTDPVLRHFAGVAATGRIGPGIQRRIDEGGVDGVDGVVERLLAIALAGFRIAPPACAPQQDAAARRSMGDASLSARWPEPPAPGGGGVRGSAAGARHACDGPGGCSGSVARRGAAIAAAPARCSAANSRCCRGRSAGLPPVAARGRPPLSRGQFLPAGGENLRATGAGHSSLATPSFRPRPPSQTRRRVSHAVCRAPRKRTTPANMRAF